MRSLIMNLLHIWAVTLLVGAASAQLQVGYYRRTCPSAELMVRSEMKNIMSVAPSLAGPLLRMHFHDCFVRGCDASILLDTKDKNNPAEKDSIPNLSLRGFQIIDRIKAKVERQCPGVVSCSDIIALVARDAVYLSNGPSWEVPTGRKDGRVSLANDPLVNLPPFFANITMLKASFASKGLNVKDLAVLSGGHTIGTSHCSSFDDRIYNFTGRGDGADVDPNLDSEYVPKLRAKCRHNDQISRVEMDPGSYRTFDTSYYKLVAKRRGLFEADAALLNDPETRAYVLRQANGPQDEFFRDFVASMVKMSSIEVLTGNQGEIRKHCAVVN